MAVNKLNHKIPWDILNQNVTFFDAYRLKYKGQRGMLYKCESVNQIPILSYGNTIMLQVGPQYAPEIRHNAVFVADRVIKEGMEIYELFKICRINRGIF